MGKILTETNIIDSKNTAPRKLIPFCTAVAQTGIHFGFKQQV